MYNYRRVYTSTSKFKTIYGNFKSPVFLDYRIMTVFVLTLLANIIFSLVFGLYTLKDGKFTISFWYFGFHCMGNLQIRPKA